MLASNCSLHDRSQRYSSFHRTLFSPTCLWLECSNLLKQHYKLECFYPLKIEKLIKTFAHILKKKISNAKELFTWIGKFNTTTFAFRKIRETFKFAVALRVHFEKSQLTF